MPFTLRSITKNRYTAICLLCCLIVFGFLSVSGMRKIAPLSTDIKNPASAQHQERVNVIYIRLTRDGFAPDAVTCPEGTYFMIVYNSAGLKVADLRLSREGGPQLRQSVLSSEKIKWKESVELTQGRYIVTEANHRDWACNITVTAK